MGSRGRRNYKRINLGRLKTVGSPTPHSVTFF